MIEDSLDLVGTVVADKYEVVSVVGEGGFAVVYRAQHQLWKRPVALKVFRALGELPAEARQELTDAFIREGALLAELSEKSTAICQARDVGVLVTPTGMSVPFMVLEWLEGSSLEQVLESETATKMLPRQLADCVRLLEPIAEALALAHARGIAHRDVKPANIFVLGDPRGDHCPVKLLDFGIAKVVQDMQSAGGAFTRTTGMTTSFTPAYAAPEQFSRAQGPTGPWTDVFALALVTVECATGRPPLDGEDFLQLGFASGDKSTRPTPRTLGAETSDAVEAVFQKALAVDRLARYPSAGAFWNDLRAALGLAPAPILAALDASLGPRSRLSAPTPNVDPVGRTIVASGSGTLSPGATLTGTTSSPARPSRGPLLAVAGLALLVGAGVASRALMRPPSPAAPAQAIAPSASAPQPVASATPSGSASTAEPPPGSCPKDMAHIPGGSAFMGLEEGEQNQRPEHKIELAPYCMDIYEVTTEKYFECSDNGECKRAPTANVWPGITAADHKIYDPLCNANDKKGRAKHPINCVSWSMADIYCKNAKKRLPTEAEWEFAARGKDSRLYPWGDEPPSAKLLNACGAECVAWAGHFAVPASPMYPEDDGFAATAPVGSFPAGKSKFGVMDMAGNVWEWVADWYGPYSAGDGVHAEVAPKGPATGKERVVRGGAFNGSIASWERPSFRYKDDPERRSYGYGFRCVADVK